MDSNQLEKTNIPGYYKDKKSGTVINMNMDQLEAYRFGKQKVKEFNALKESHDGLKSRLAAIEKALGL